MFMKWLLMTFCVNVLFLSNSGETDVYMISNMLCIYPYCYDTYICAATNVLVSFESAFYLDGSLFTILANNNITTYICHTYSLSALSLFVDNLNEPFRKWFYAIQHYMITLLSLQHTVAKYK